MPDDHALLTALRARSPEAFRTLFEMYSDRMYRLAAGILQNDQEAEDVVQDAFLRFFEALETFQGRSQVGTWLYRTVHNLSIDRIRRHRPQVELLEDDDALPVPSSYIDWADVPEMRLTEAEVSRYLQAAIASLPEKLRAMFILYEIEGLSMDESAQVLEIGLSAAKVRLHRARLFLREKLSGYFSEIAERSTDNVS